MTTPTTTTPRILNLGCGHKHLAGAVNLDVTPATHPDVVHDLNVRPWPFEANSFDDVRAMDVIEHLDDVLGTMEELHRHLRARRHHHHHRAALLIVERLYRSDAPALLRRVQF